MSQDQPLDSIESIIDDIGQGKMVIIMDDEDRENEGDLLMAARHVTPEAINFMARYGRGLICLSLTEERCQQLRLPLMVRDNASPYSTNFTVSIEAAQGVTTGISAADRACTIQAAVAADATPEDLVQPGHIFPLMAQNGGVLTRAGHTETGCDLARLAGLEPAAVLVEILREDGEMARRPELHEFAQHHGLKIGTVASLIHYRMTQESSLTQQWQGKLPTQFGQFHLQMFEDMHAHQCHFALTMGTIDPNQSTLVRVHLPNPLTDFLQADLVGSWSLRTAMQTIAKAGQGVILVLHCQPSPADWLASVQQLDQTNTSPHTSQSTLRTHGIGAQILRQLGVRRMRLLGAPVKLSALSGFGLEIDEYLHH